MALTAAELQAVISIDDSPFARGLDGILGSLEQWGGKAGKVLAGAGALAGGLFAAGAAAGMNTQDLAAGMQAQMGLTTEQAAEYGDLAGRLYAQNYGESIEDVGVAMTAVVTSIEGMRDANAAAVEDMTARAMTFADTMEIDVARASQVAGQLISTGLAKDGTEAFDLLMAASQRVPAALREDILDAGDEYGQFFATLGYTGEQAFAMLVDGAEKGMYGIDKTGDAIKEFTILASDGSTSTSDAFSALGLDAGKMADDIQAGGDRAGTAFTEVLTAFNEMPDNAAKAQTAIALFGTPLEDLSTAGIPEFINQLSGTSDAMEGFQGTTDRAADALGSTASAKFTSFFRTLKTETIGAIGGYVIPYVTTAAGYLSDNLGPAFKTAGDYAVTAGGVLRDFAGWVQANQTPIMIVAGLIAAVFIPHLIALGIAATVNAIKMVAAWVMTQASAIAAAAVHSAQIARMIAGWVLLGAQSMIAAARIAASWFIALGPIGWAIAAIAGVVALVIAYWDEIKQWTGEAWDWVVAKVLWAVDWLVDAFMNWTLLGIIISHWDSIVAATEAAWQWVVDKVLWARDFAVNLFMNWTLYGLILQHWDSIVGAFRNGVGWAVELVTSLPGRALSALSSLGTAVTTPVRNAFTGALSIATSLGGQIVEWIRGIPGRILSLAGSFGSAGRTLLQNFLDGMRNAAGIIAGIAGNIWDYVKGMLNTAIRAINDAIPNRIGGDTLGIDLPANPFPEFATGGRVNGATLAWIGEGREAETVLPDSVLRGLLERTHESGRRAAGSGALIGKVTFNQRNGPSSGQVMRDLSHAMRVVRFGGVYAGSGA